MLDALLTAYEAQCLEALDGIPIATAVTRRALDFKTAKTNYFAVDITILPLKGEGHPVSSMNVELAIVVRVYGRGTAGSTTLDRVRALQDLAIERISAVSIGALANTTGIEWETQIDMEGATVIDSRAVLSSSILHTSGTGLATGIVETTTGSFPMGTARGALAQPRVYAAGMDQVHTAEPGDDATITALFAGLAGGGAERLELRKASGEVADSAVLSDSAGAHEFTVAQADAGNYTLAIVRESDDQDLATSPGIRVVGL